MHHQVDVWFDQPYDTRNQNLTSPGEIVNKSELGSVDLHHHRVCFLNDGIETNVIALEAGPKTFLGQYNIVNCPGIIFLRETVYNTTPELDRVYCLFRSNEELKQWVVLKNYFI